MVSIGTNTQNLSFRTLAYWLNSLFKILTTVVSNIVYFFSTDFHFWSPQHGFKHDFDEKKIIFLIQYRIEKPSPIKNHAIQIFFANLCRFLFTLMNNTSATLRKKIRNRPYLRIGIFSRSNHRNSRLESVKINSIKKH
jgi:hypothetical protein